MKPQITPQPGDRGYAKPDKAPKVQPLRARYSVPPPSSDLCWLETKHFLAPHRETVLLAWPRKERFTFRTGRHDGRRYVLNDDTVPHEQPTFFAFLK